MLIRILILLVILPLFEIAVLLLSTQVVGFSWTLVLVLATGAVGAWLLRRHGLIALRGIREELACGRLPATELIDGVLIMLAGVLLLTPGLLTDALAIAILLPTSRNWIRHWVVDWFKRRWRLQVGAPGGSQAAASQVIDSYVVAHNEKRSD